MAFKMRLSLAVLLLSTLALVRSQDCPVPASLSSQLSFADPVVTEGCAATGFTCERCLCGLATSAFTQFSAVPRETYDLQAALGANPTIESVTTFFAGCTGVLAGALLRDQPSAAGNLLANGCDTNTFPSACIQNLLSQLTPGTNTTTNSTAPPASPSPAPINVTSSPPPGAAPPTPANTTAEEGTTEDGMCPFPEAVTSTISFASSSITEACDTRFTCDSCLCAVTTTALNGLLAGGLNATELGRILITLSNGTLMTNEPNRTTSDAIAETVGALLNVCQVPLARGLIADGQTVAIQNLATCTTFFEEGVNANTTTNSTNSTTGSGSSQSCESVLIDRVSAILAAAGGPTFTPPPNSTRTPSPPGTVARPPPAGTTGGNGTTTLAGGLAMPGLGSGVWSLVVAAAGSLLLGVMATF